MKQESRDFGRGRFNEFNEKYEIVSRNGNIYTIKEREK